MNTKIRSARTAVRLIRERLASLPNALMQAAIGAHLDAIDAALESLLEQPAPPPRPEPPPTPRELEDAFIRSALEVRRMDQRLRGFSASQRTRIREMGAYYTAYDTALEALAESRAKSDAQRMAGAASQ